MGKHTAAAAAAAAPSDAPQRKKTTGCGGVSWKRVFVYQTWGSLVVLLAACVITGVAHFLATPAVRPLRLYDAAISLPQHPDSVSIQAAAAIPFAALIVTVLLVEFAALCRKQSLTMAVHATIHIILWGIVGFAVVLAVTEATKPFASRFRPDFMSRCKPVAREGQPLALDQPVRCAGALDKAYDDGRKSFPSGHSSNSMSLCWYTLLYFVHALYWRDGFRYMGGLWARRSCGMRLLMEVLQGLFICWALAVVAIAWCIGVSRFRDNRHNIDDILGGFVASLLWMTPVVLIALGQLNYYQEQLRKAEEKDEADAATLPVVAPGTPAATAAAAQPSSHATLQSLHSNDKDAGAAAAAAADAGVNGAGQV